jgi:hypothetical protein
MGVAAMTDCHNPWFSLVEDSMRLTFEAQDVIGLRIAKAASGSFDAADEAVRMVIEKSQAAWDASFLITQSMIAGEGHLAPARAVDLYRQRVRANRRRLSRDARR